MQDTTSLQEGYVSILVVLIVTLLFFHRYIFPKLSASIKNYLHQKLNFRKLEPKLKYVLQNANPFYANLNQVDKLLFEKRVRKFMDMKTFIARGNIKKVTPEMKTIIAGAAIQITYGFPTVYFKHFYRIYIYPTHYRSTTSGKYHKGEVNTRGAIVLSWKNLVEGFKDYNDGINLGLHEMAHALQLENLMEYKEFDFIDSKALQDFYEIAKLEIARIKKGGISIFRKYSITNLQEFFSVAVEIFFERPEEYQITNPLLFDLLKKILKIDPLKHTNLTTGFKNI